MSSFNKFDFSKFASSFSTRGQQRADLVFMARTAESAERYDDMCRFMKELVNWAVANGEQLTTEERNLLSVAYKNVIGARRASWRCMYGDNELKQDPLLNEYSSQVEKEISSVCEELLSLLKDKLVENCASTEDGNEAKVFYLKMAGDYYRYLAECIENDSNKGNAASYYERALTLAKDETNGLQPTHPIRLGLALNYSVCFYEILKDREKACNLARDAFDQAISKLDKLAEPDYKDSTLIMQLLRDNLTLWQSGSDGDDDDEN
jgi:hypothetical protein